MCVNALDVGAAAYSSTESKQVHDLFSFLRGQEKDCSLLLPLSASVNSPVQCCLTSAETIRTIRDGDPRTATSAETLRTIRDGDPRTAMSAETIRTIRDGDPRTAMSAETIRTIRDGHLDFYTAPELRIHLAQRGVYITIPPPKGKTVYLLLVLTA